MDYQELTSIFTSDPSSAIEKCQEMICSVSNFDSYQEFYSYNQENAHISTCQHEWSTPEVCVFCRDCSVNNNACVCLPCFLNGNHEGHRYAILTGTSGNCDCGDLTLWKRSGYCSKHRGLIDENHNPEDYLDEKLQTLLTDVVYKAAFTALKNFTNKNTENAEKILQFVSSFLKFGDGFRRLIARSLTEKIDFKSFLMGISDYSPEFNQSFQQLCGLLINDQLFIRNYSIISYDVISDTVLKDTASIMVNGNDSVPYAIWNEFWFHSFSPGIIKYNVLNKKWKWIDFYINNLVHVKTLFDFIGNESYSEMPNPLITLICHLKEATNVQPNEETQIFFDNFVTKILGSESYKDGADKSIIVTSFDEEREKEYFFSLLHFFLFFYDVFTCFKDKPNLKYDKLFEELEKLIDISPIFLIGKNSIGKGSGKENENDKFVLSLINQNIMPDKISPSNYKSFHNGGTIFISHPIYQSLVSLFRLDDISRVKITRLLSSQQYQGLRVKLGIITLKTIASFIVHRQSIASEKNKSLDLIYNFFNQPNLASNFFTKYVPLFQVLIGIQGANKTMNEEFCLKEFFAFELAREIGMFDDFSDKSYNDENIAETIKQMIFAFLYLSLLLVTERTLYHFEAHKFIREQIIFALKNGVHSINVLNELYDKSVFESWLRIWGFNDVLMSIADANNKGNDDQQQSEENEETQESSKSFQQDVSFYLKENVEWNPISAINSLNKQMALMNNVISKDSDKLLKIPEFQPEETFFFGPDQTSKEGQPNRNSNENSIQNDNNNNNNDNHNNNNDNNNNNNNNNDSCDAGDLDVDGLNIHLKQFLMTPTVLSIVYHTLRTSAGIDSPISDLNDHLAMNILILVSKFIKEEKEEKQQQPLKVSSILYSSLTDLITKMKKVVFNYRIENGSLLSKFKKLFKHDDSNVEKAIIENTLNQQNFVQLLKIKFSSSKLPPKSFIDILLEKGKLGQDVLNQISSYIHLDCINNDSEKQSKVQDIKQIKHQKASKLKADIMNHYKNMIANYNASSQSHLKGMDSMDDISISNSEPFALEKEVCSICSTYKKNEIFSYPLYIYRTKFPFIIDKPPLFNLDENDCTPVDDNYEDFDHSGKDNGDGEEEEEHEPEINPDEIIEFIANNFPQLAQTEGLTEEQRQERRATIQVLFNTILEQQIRSRRSDKQRSNYIKEFRRQQTEENEEFKTNKEKKQSKRCTAGANYVIQFGICQHPVHPKCVQEDVFTCPIDRSVKNGLLPSIETIPRSVVFKDLETFELNDEENSLGHNVIESVTSFIDKFTSFFNGKKINVFIELIKSISGLISTYEIRLRSLPDCLDSEKTILLSRNLFITVWYAYRIKKKPEMTIPNDESTDCESRMTTFQRFIKKLIESDENEVDVKKIIASIVDLNDSSKEKENCLFLRRVCLAEHFLLSRNVQPSSMSCMIDWDEVLSPSFLSERYDVNFQSIDDDFEFKPFTFMKLPKDFLRLSEEPYNLPIRHNTKIFLFNLLDYNYLIDNYNDVTGEINVDSVEKQIKKNEKNLSNCDDLKNIENFLQSFYCCKHYPSVLLFIGKYASEVFVVDQNYFGSFSPFYLDRYGCADIDYKRSQPLFLNEEKYERFIDLFLSGDFSYSLITINRLK